MTCLSFFYLVNPVIHVSYAICTLFCGLFQYACFIQITHPDYFLWVFFFSSAVVILVKCYLFYKQTNKQSKQEHKWAESNQTLLNLN